jgi:D-glycero-alpha-D-manno-heptose-7-phosphate kinase
MTVLPCLTPVPAPFSRLAPRPLRRAVASAPMRVSLAGGGSDLPPFLSGIGGRVVGTAVDLRVRALAEPFDRGWVRLELSATGLSFTRRRGEPRSRDTSARLLEETLSYLSVDEGVRLRVETELVPGTGLGGSAAAAVAALAAIEASITMGPEAASACALDAESLSLGAVRVERDGLGIAGGSQDQIFAACGGMLDLRFDEGGLSRREVVAADPALVAALAAGLLLVDTGQRRVSGEVIDRAQASPAVTAELIAAAGDVADGLREGSLARVLAGMRRSSAAKVARDPDANAGAIDLGRLLFPLGAEVVRMCGAGGGGHVLVWAAPEHHADILAALGDATVRRPAISAPGVRLEAAEEAIGAEVD